MLDGVAECNRLKISSALSQGASLKPKGVAERLPFHQAIVAGCASSVVSDLLPSITATDVNQKDLYGNNALHSAVISKNADALDVLLAISGDGR